MPSADPDYWNSQVLLTLERYQPLLLRQVGTVLIKSRTTIPEDELAERIVQTLANPPLIDRRIKELPEPCRRILGLMARFRQPRWKLGHLLLSLAAIGTSEGITPIKQLFELGFLFPTLPADDSTLPGFEPWFDTEVVLEREVFASPLVLARARDEDLGLPDLAQADTPTATSTTRVSDGWEWPLRIAATLQLSHEGTFRQTLTRGLFKRDLTRLQANDVLASPPADHLHLLPDPGVLCLYWAEATGQLTNRGDELAPTAQPLTPEHLHEELIQLIAALTRIEMWDPIQGYVPLEAGTLSPFPSVVATLFNLLAVASQPLSASALAEYLWEFHSSWQSFLPRDVARDHGRVWVEAFLFGLAYPLRVIEVLEPAEPTAERRVRLSDLGRHLFAGGSAPEPPPQFPQTLMVQPNAEILAYRQGLTPGLIRKLTRFARWKVIGPACTLELTPEQTYHGLEAGLTLSGIVQTLNQHGTRPVPPPVLDLLQRWANKRERISVYYSATLVEFSTPAELDQALARGIVATRVTDRIGICSDGGDPDFKQLRLLGNRDYDARPTRCLSVAEDGITLTVDHSAADLLLEADIVRFTTPITPEPTGIRRYQIVPEALRSAVANWSLEELDDWFVARTGDRLPAPARLFLLAPQLPPVESALKLVIQIASVDAVDGLMQWPETRGLIQERLGPKTLSVETKDYPQFRQVLTQLGMTWHADAAG